MYRGKVAKQTEAQKLYGTVHSKCGRYMQGKKRVVLGEVCTVSYAE